ncbi:hypothetical protein Tco_1280396 [Tanacetum coccineum]
MLLTRLLKHVVSIFPELAIDRYILHDRVMHPLAPYYERKKRSDRGKKRPRESNASSSSTTLNHPSSSHPLDDPIDVNDDESFHSNPSSPSQNISFSLNDIFRVYQNPPHESLVCFGKKGKLAPRFVGSFEIIEKVGPVAYRLDLLEELNGVHDTLHVSNLKKCLADPTLQVPLDEIRVDAKLNFMEERVEILEREFKKLKRSRIAIVKVRWNSKRDPEFMWEREDQMKLKYPNLFSDVSS